MGTTIQGDSRSSKVAPSSFITGMLRRAPLVMMTVVFALVSFRYLHDPVHAAAAVGISFTSPGGIVVARVGFAAFPLAFAILAFASLIFPSRRLAGLYMVLTLVSVVMVIRIFGILVDHSTESAKLLAPEVVLLTLSLIAIRLESAGLRGAPKSGAPSFKAIVE